MHSINVRYLFTYFCHLTCTSSHNITPCHLTCTSSRNITPVTSPVHRHTQCFTNKWTDFTANWYKWSMGKQWNDQLQGSRGQRSMSQKVEVRLEGQAAASFSTPFSQQVIWFKLRNSCIWWHRKVFHILKNITICYISCNSSLVLMPAALTHLRYHQNAFFTISTQMGIGRVCGVCDWLLAHYEY